MTTYSAEEVIGKGCEIKLNGTLFYCYNETSLMHFVKCNKKSERLSIKSKNNLMSLSADQVKRFIKLGSITVTVGNVPQS
jgi:hypothetical protein